MPTGQTLSTSRMKQLPTMPAAELLSAEQAQSTPGAGTFAMPASNFPAPTEQANEPLSRPPAVSVPTTSTSAFVPQGQAAPLRTLSPISMPTRSTASPPNCQESLPVRQDSGAHVESPIGFSPSSPASAPKRNGSLFSQISSPGSDSPLRALSPSSIQNQMREGISFIASGIDSGSSFANKHAKHIVRTADEKVDGQLPDLVSTLVGGTVHGYAAAKVTKNFIKVDGERKPAPEAPVAVEPSCRGCHPPPGTRASAPPVPTTKKGSSGGKLKKLFGAKQKQRATM